MSQNREPAEHVSYALFVPVDQRGELCLHDACENEDDARKLLIAGDVGVITLRGTIRIPLSRGIYPGGPNRRAARPPHARTEGE